jgi:hypothetical protein
MHAGKVNLARQVAVVSVQAYAMAVWLYAWLCAVRLPVVRGVVNIATVKMAETLYDAYTSAILGAVGKKETTNSELDRLGNALMPGFYRGAYPRGKQPGPDGTRHVLLANGMSGPPGDHWHAIYREPGHEDLVYDSFGRPQF